MIKISKTNIVPYSTVKMYALVNDIESYPNFLTWCSDAKILSQQEDRLSATLSLSIGSISQSFTTQNTMQSGKQIIIQLVEGPFKHLYGRWLFSPHNENSSQVALEMNFEFKNKIIQFILGRGFHKAMDSLVDSFLQRADQLYGKN